MIVRDATLKDIDAMEIMGPKFFKYADFNKKGIQYDSNSFRSLLKGMIENDYGVLLIIEDDEGIFGSIGGIKAPWMMDNSQMMLMETWWWINEDKQNHWAGALLIKAFIERAKILNIDFVIMVTLDGNKEEKLKETYHKLGFEHLEHHFIKKVN